jgi:1-acyl-sn-glycerol-3-phosphate acyltransferase
MSIRPVLAAQRAWGAVGVSIRETLRARRLGEHELRARAWRLQAGLADVAAVQGMAIAVCGELPTTPAILVANHVSYLDPIAIGSQVPCAPIAKGEVSAWPVIGATSRSLNVMFVNRASVMSRARVLRRALTTLRAGVSILNFAEGTTTDGSRLLPFHRGIFGLARIAQVPVVPIALRYSSDDMAWFGAASFLPHYLRIASRRRSAAYLDVGDPIAPDAAPSAEALAQLTHDRIAHMLRGNLESHATVIRLRVPAPRPDAVLPAARRDLAVAE